VVGEGEVTALPSATQKKEERYCDPTRTTGRVNKQKPGGKEEEGIPSKSKKGTQGKNSGQRRTLN